MAGHFMYINIKNANATFGVYNSVICALYRRQNKCIHSFVYLFLLILNRVINANSIKRDK